MASYTPDDVKMLIEMLKSSLPKKGASEIQKKLPDGKPFLNKTERTIRFLEQRYKYFNPRKEMLQYIISLAKNSDLDKIILEKMKEDVLTKK